MDNLTIHDRGSTVRMRKMDWMRLPEYAWWLIHTDCMPDQSPRLAVDRFLCWFGPFNMSFGYATRADLHTGPPQSSSI